MAIYDLIVIAVTYACYGYRRAVRALVPKRIRLWLSVVSPDKSSGDGNDLLRLASAKEFTTLCHATSAQYPVGRVEDLAIGQS
jgi:hypothetical protein